MRISCPPLASPQAAMPFARSGWVGSLSTIHAGWPDFRAGQGCCTLPLARMIAGLFDGRRETDHSCRTAPKLISTRAGSVPVALPPVLAAFQGQPRADPFVDVPAPTKTCRIHRPCTGRPRPAGRLRGRVLGGQGVGRHSAVVGSVRHGSSLRGRAGDKHSRCRRRVYLGRPITGVKGRRRLALLTGEKTRTGRSFGCVVDRGAKAWRAS